MVAGRVGRAHGLDGSFHVQDPVARLLDVAIPLTVGGRPARVTRRAGTDERPIVRLDVAASREAVEALRGHVLDVARADAPPLEDGEFWAEDLVGALVVAGDRELGVVRRLVPLPSVEALELDGGDLVPMVRDAIVRVDLEARVITVDEGFLGAA